MAAAVGVGDSCGHVEINGVSMNVRNELAYYTDY